MLKYMTSASTSCSIVSSPEGKGDRRTIRIGHLCKPLPYRHASRDVQHVPDDRQSLRTRRVREPGLPRGASRYDVPRERDEGNCSPYGDDKAGECPEIVRHEARNWLGVITSRVDCTVVRFMRDSKWTGPGAPKDVTFKPTAAGSVEPSSPYVPRRTQLLGFHCEPFRNRTTTAVASRPMLAALDH